MDRFAEKQAQIARQRQALNNSYPSLWEAIIKEWKSPGSDDRAWLTYSANYLFRTAGVRWALDPLTPHWRLRGHAPQVDVSALEALSFVLLTHGHKDHLDLALLTALQRSAIRWIVPEPILPLVIEQAGLSPKNIHVPKALQPIEVEGMLVTPFEGEHWETTPEGARKGIPAWGYLVEFNDKRWLFPGDTRSYTERQLAGFHPLDGLFAHLWLGRRCALLEQSPLEEAFCRCHLSPQPRKIILTHLHEFGRDANDFWDASHAARVSAKLQEIRPGIPVITALTGESIIL